MVIINFSNKLDRLSHYLRYLDVEGEFKVFSQLDKNWVDLINNNIEKKLCYCFNYDDYKDEDFDNIVKQINHDIYQNLIESIIFISDKPFEKLPQNNNLPCFLFTNIINDITGGGGQKYLFDDDFYFQFIVLLNIIKDKVKDKDRDRSNIFYNGDYYGITSAGLFKEQINDVSEILNNVVSQILSDEKNNLLFDNFIGIKHQLENLNKSFSQNISLERIFKFSEINVLSQIQSFVSSLWEGKFLEKILLTNFNKPNVDINEGFIGQIRQKLINTLKELSYYPSSFIVDYKKQSEKDLLEIKPLIDEFNKNVYSKFLDSEKKFYIATGIWFITSILLVLLIPNKFTSGIIILALVLLVIFFYFLPRINFKKDLDSFYYSLEKQISEKNKKYINSNNEWIIAYVRTLVEDFFESINPKYGEVLDFLNNILPYKIYNFTHKYWDEIKIENMDIKSLTEELAFELNQQILLREKKYLKDLLIEFQTKIFKKISDSYNNPDFFWGLDNTLIASKLNTIVYYLSNKNLLKIVKTDDIIIESKDYHLFIPEHIRTSLHINFSINSIHNIKTKNYIILSWIETYKNKK